MPANVTVAIPTLNGGTAFEQTLAAVAAQHADGLSLELLVCDSGSTDGTLERARNYGATVVEIPRREFSHGGTRNLLMEHARADRVAFLTQDAVPADNRWLQRLLAGFEIADDVGLVFGPYVARPDASLSVQRELAQWFASFSPDGSPRVDRLVTSEEDIPARALMGHRGYFTDANGCVLRDAWRRVPFPDVAYAEDHALAHDMLRAGFAKVFVPDAAVIHSHAYSLGEWLRRSFDEARAIDQTYGFEEQRDLRRAVLGVWGSVGADLRFARAQNRDLTAKLAAESLLHHLARGLGTLLGAHAENLPRPLIRRLSLEGRG